MSSAEAMKQVKMDWKDPQDLVGPKTQVAPEAREVGECSLFDSQE